MKKGFTFIELLVVIAIIGILLSIILISYNEAKVKRAGGAPCEDYKGMSWNDTPARCVHENF